MNIASIRPGVADNRTAFEPMANIYKWLQTHHNHDFRIIIAESDSFSDDNLATSTVPRSAWKPTIPHFPVFLRKYQYRRYIDPIIDWADIVLTLDPTIFYQGALVIERSHRMNTPVLFDASKTISDTDPHWQLIRPLIERAVTRTAGILATVPKVLERYRELKLLDAIHLSEFMIVGHPVDLGLFSPVNRSHNNDNSIRVLSVARLVPEKGIYYIIEALTPLIQCGDIKLSFIGDGPMRSLLRREIANRDISDGVDLLGTVPHDHMPTVLNDADIFLNHSVSIDTWEEYFGAANLEAMACELPCVLTDCGGIPYVVRNDDVAEFVPQRDVSTLRKTVSNLVNNPERRRKMGSAARNYVKQAYAIDVIGSRFNKILDRVR